MISFFTLAAASADICIDMFLTGAVTGITLITTGSKVKRYYSKKNKKYK